MRSCDVCGHLLLACQQVVMIFAAVVIAIHPVAADWPLSQTLALLIQTMVMFMKMVRSLPVTGTGVCSLQPHPHRVVRHATPHPIPLISSTRTP